MNEKMDPIMMANESRFDNFKNFISSLSLPRIMLINVGILTVVNVLFALLQVPAGYDFCHFYTIEAIQILSGKIPYVHFTPVYPIVAEYYFALFGLFGMNPIIARIFQSMLLISCMLVFRDISSLLNFKNPNWHLLWFMGSPILIYFSLFNINFDILMLLFLLLAMDCFLREQGMLTGVFIAIGMLVKIFPITFLIVVLLFYVRAKSWKRLLACLISCLLTCFLIYLPFSILHFIIFQDSLLSFFLNFIEFFLAPLLFFEMHPLNLPYCLFFAIVPRSILKNIANVVAFSLLISYCIYGFKKRLEPRDALQSVMIPSIFLFFLFQPYITPWYVPWVLVPRYLRRVEDPLFENYIYQPPVLFNLLVSLNINFLFKFNIEKDPTYFVGGRFAITPILLFPIFIVIVGLALKQLSVMTLVLNESHKKRVILIPCTIILSIIAIVGLFALLFY
ncbi:MAG: glycosyltransferase 87 family protein [Candidatus Helarchaeota archaeon]